MVKQRDSLGYPFAAAGWSLVVGATLTVIGLGLSLRRFATHDMPLETHAELLAVQASSGALGLALGAIVVLLVAHHRQRRRPDRVGHAPGAALLTGGVAVAIGAIASWLPSMAYGLVAEAMSPIGFVLIGAALSVIHPAAIGVGALFGSAMRMQEAEPAPEADVGRNAIVGTLVFFGVLAFVVDLSIGLLPLIADDLVGYSGLSHAQWSSLCALIVAGAVAGGYAWMRHGRSGTAARWTGDAWAGLAAVPMAVIATAALGVAAAIALYALDDIDPPLVLIPIALLGVIIVLGVMGVAIGAVRMRLGRPRAQA
ncbi:MAG: hypothetical protein ACRC2H_08450 [Silanimonas sp.]